MVKSLSKTYGHLQSNSVKMPSVMTVGSKGVKVINISTSGEFAKRLNDLGVPSKKREDSKSDRETFVIKDSLLDNFYFATLEEDPKLNWTFGLIDIVATAEKNKGIPARQQTTYYKVNNIDQLLLENMALKNGFDFVRSFTDHLKNIFNPENNKNIHYKTGGTFQMLAVFYMNKIGKLEYLGMVLNNLTASRSIFCTKGSGNKKYSCISFEQGRAYKANLGVVNVNGDPMVHFELNESEVLEGQCLEDASEGWDEMFDDYHNWQVYQQSLLQNVLDNNNKNVSKNVSKIEEDDFDDHIPDFDADENMPK